MDKNLIISYELKIPRLKKACATCQYGFDVVDTKEEATALVSQIIQSGNSCSVGGLRTLFETGIVDMLEKRSDINYLDRYHTQDAEAIYHQSLNADVYVTSTNALTMNGELYNIDSNGNRVAAMIYGPKKVIVVLGLNKLVETIEDAHSRMKFVAAPCNNIRLKKPNPCTKVGYCVDCNSPSKLCGNEVTIRHSSKKDRIHLIIVKEFLGF